MEVNRVIHVQKAAEVLKGRHVTAPYYEVLRDGNMLEMPEGYKDAIHSSIDIYMGFWDKVKVLLGWRLVVKYVALCENEVGKIEAGSTVKVWRRRRPQCTAMGGDQNG